jgi:hypothetical protein
MLMNKVMSKIWIIVSASLSPQHDIFRLRIEAQPADMVGSFGCTERAFCYVCPSNAQYMLTIII